MLGAVLYGPHDVRFEERDVPKIIRPTDAIITISATCVCGFLTLLAIVLRFAGINWPVPYLTYPGAYLMQTFFQRFLEWIPWQYADNLISELLLFFALNVLGYAFVIFLLLRIFFPDRSSELPPLTGKK